MKAELEALRRAIDEATEHVIAAECALDEARGVERVATAARQAAEAERNAAVARLTEARAALDAKLGIGPVRMVAAPLPVPPVVARTTPAPAPPVAEEPWEDDDDPVR